MSEERPEETFKIISFAPRTLEDAERHRKRKLKRRAEKMPLFEATGVAEQVAPVPDAEAILEQLNREAELYVARLNDVSRQNVEKATEYRARVAELVSAEQLAEMDAYRWRVYPEDPLYAVEYWQKKLKELTGKGEE